MSPVIAILFFVGIPIVLIVIVWIGFGALQRRNRQHTLQSPHPGFIPIRRESSRSMQTSGQYGQPITQRQGQVPGGFAPIGRDVRLDGPCYLTGEPQSSCGCEECQELRRSIQKK